MYIIIICMIILLLCRYKKNESFLTKNSYIISIFLTENHCIETDNLLTTLQSHNLLDKVVVTCLDEKCFNFMKKWNVTLSLFNQDVQKEATYHTLEFRKIVKNKLKILINLLQKHQIPVLHIDTDVVVLNKKLDTDIIQLCQTEFDIIFQSDNMDFEKIDNRCTGFMLLNNTKNTRYCLKEAIKVMNKNMNHKDHWGDQKSINYVINKNPTKYNIQIFNHKDYPNGYRYFNNLDTVYKNYKPIIVHNNYIKGLQNKINRFKKHNLWFLPKKVAICFFGLTRSLKYNLKYIEKNIYNILKANNYDYDIFIHTYHKDAPHSNYRAKESNIILDNDEYKLLNPTKYIIDNETTTDTNIPYKLYTLHGDPWNNNFSSFQNFIKQLYSLYRVTKLWEPNKNMYDAVIYIRPDTIITRPININNIKQYKLNTIYVPNHHHSHYKGRKGCNDRFAYGDPDSMIIYGQRYKQSLDYSMTRSLHAESLLRYVLDSHQINIIPTNMIVCRRRANGIIIKTDLQLLSLDERLDLITN